MILDDKYVYYAIELRMKTRRITGSLCKVPDPLVLHNAMMYHDVWNDEEYLSNPFSELTSDLMGNLTKDVFRIFISLNEHYMPPFTYDEIRLIIAACEKFGYMLTHNKGYISIKRDPTYDKDNIRTRY